MIPCVCGGMVVSFQYPEVTKYHLFHSDKCHVRFKHGDSHQVSGTFLRAHTRTPQKGRTWMSAVGSTGTPFENTEFPTPFLILKKSFIT